MSAASADCNEEDSFASSEQQLFEVVPRKVDSDDKHCARIRPTKSPSGISDPAREALSPSMCGFDLMP